jgi:hypothetical protein
MDLNPPYLQDGLLDSSSSYGGEPSLRRYVLAARVRRASYGLRRLFKRNDGNVCLVEKCLPYALEAVI